MTIEQCWICGKPATHPSRPIPPVDDQGVCLSATEPSCDRHALYVDKQRPIKRHGKKRRTP